MAFRSARRESSRKAARQEWARRETPELILGIRRRFVAALAGSTHDAGRIRYERAVATVVSEVKVEILRLTGDLDLALHAGERTRDICQETARALQRA